MANATSNGGRAAAPPDLTKQPAQVFTHPEEPGRIAELLQRIAGDARVIARDEIELARGQLEHHVRASSMDAAGVVIGAIVALIGLGFACVAAAVGLAYAIPLWASLLVFFGVYVVIGGGVAALAASKLKRDVAPDLKVPVSEGARTLRGIKESLHA